MAHSIAQQWQDRVQSEEGDSDLYRKLAYYLTPNLLHWVTGKQAGSMEDLDELVKRRVRDSKSNANKKGNRGDGHEALTSPE